MERIVVEIDKKQKAAFKKKAEGEGHTMVFLLRRFIERYLLGKETTNFGGVTSDTNRKSLPASNGRTSERP